MIDYDYPKEETLLTPYQTNWRTEGLIIDTEHLLTPNRYGEFGITWCPNSTNDEQMFQELLEGFQTQLQMSLTFNSRKVVTPHYQDDRGFFFSSQLFQPKVSLKLEHSYELINRTATLSGHARDLPNGLIVLQLDFLDVDEDTRGDEPSEEELARACNYDW